MKKNKKNKDSKMPEVQIDESLNKYQGKIIFKETLKKAKESLKNVALPKNITSNSKTTEI